MKVLIIGGGLSGLSTAINLADMGYDITLLEASPKFGGKVYSFYSDKLKNEIDNGQHLMLGCYNETIKFLGKIKSLQYVDLINGINIPFVTNNNRIFYLKCSSNFYPFNLFYAFLTFKYLTLSEKMKIGGLFFDILFNKDKRDLSAYDYLIKHKQKELITKFWEPILISIFNCALTEISKNNLIKILKKIFLSDSKSFRFLLPNVPLNKIFIENSIKIFIEKGINYKVNERVVKVINNSDKITEIITTKSKYNNFDYVVFAIPTYSLAKLFDLEILNTAKYNPIISAHLKVITNKLTDKYYTIPGSPIQWIFNNGNVLSLVTSNPGKLIELSENELKTLYLKGRETAVALTYL